MSDTANSNEGTASGNQREFPFGLSSRGFFVIVVVGTIVIPGLLVGLLEAAGLSMLGNFVWIIGYGTGIFVVWYLWLRPLDLVGAVEQDTSRATPTDADSVDDKPTTSDDRSSNDS